MFYKVASETTYEKIGRERNRKEGEGVEIHPFCVKLGKSIFYKIDMLFIIYSLTKVHFKICYCWLSIKAFVLKYKIFSKQYNEIFDLGFNTMCYFCDIESNIL